MSGLDIEQFRQEALYEVVYPRRVVRLLQL